MTSVSTAINRMQFLRGMFSARRAPKRPPWSLPEIQFLDSCERCDDCIKACPETILIKGRGGFPEVDFSQAGCSFCGQCLGACKGRALLGAVEDRGGAWDLRAEITGECLSMRGVVCRSCGEVCDERAIRFRLEVGGIARPLLDESVCSGCGACFSVCPVRSVLIDAPAPEIQRHSRGER